MQNVQRALGTLRCAADVPALRASELRAESLVDGDRETTLTFLWTLLLHFQASGLPLLGFAPLQPCSLL